MDAPTPSPRSLFKEYTTLFFSLLSPFVLWFVYRFCTERMNWEPYVGEVIALPIATFILLITWWHAIRTLNSVQPLHHKIIAAAVITIAALQLLYVVWFVSYAILFSLAG